MSVRNHPHITVKNATERLIRFLKEKSYRMLTGETEHRLHLPIGIYGDEYT